MATRALKEGMGVTSTGGSSAELMRKVGISRWEVKILKPKAGSHYKTGDVVIWDEDQMK